MATSRFRSMFPTAKVSDSKAYLAALRKVVDGADQWELKDAPHRGTPGFVAVYQGTEFPGEGLDMYAYAPKPDGNICFAPRADKWAGKAEGEDVADAEINAAYRLFEPLTREAAKHLGIEFHMHYAKTKYYQPSCNLSHMLDSFVYLANLNALHYYDWQRFYMIVRYCHRHKVQMQPRDLARELTKRNVPDAVVAKLEDLYGFGRELLACRYRWKRQQVGHAPLSK